MSRVDTRSQSIKIKSNPNSANICRFISLIAIVTLVVISYFIIKKPIESLGDPSDQYNIKNIPEVYSRLEAIDPEERDVFEGFRTSFLPPEEVLLAREHRITKKSAYKDNVTSDQAVRSNKKDVSTRVKRMSNSTHTDYKAYVDRRERLSKRSHDNNAEVETEEENHSESEDYEMNYSDYEDEDNIKSIVYPEMHVDRGPFDDVVEQIRGQPELEEGEKISSVHIFKPSKPYTGIHAFWKGQGDKDTIRTTQANIMKQYMDAEADPCHDFYQYACGNWASLNPIPPDKAGYDTFEMLRENLDAVLMDLLELKKNESITYKYPGPHLILEDTFLIFLKNYHCSAHRTKRHSSSKTYFSTDDSKEKRQKNERIRRNIKEKSKIIQKPLTKSKHKSQKYILEAKGRNKEKYTLNNTKIKVIKNKYLLKPQQSIHTRKLMEYHKRSKRKRNIKIKIEHENRKNVKRKIAHDPANGDAALKARFLFKSCMDYDILQKRAHQPLLDLLELLGGWPILDSKWNDSNFDWLELMAKLRLYNNDILISEWVGPDIKNSDEYVIQFDQTSLGLPTRDYFLQASNKVYLNAYKDYLITIAMLLGGEPSHVNQSANILIEFETKLAKITSAPEDRRNVSELYRRMPLKKLEELVPQVEWRRYLCVVMNRTVHPDETVVLFALCYVRHLVELIKETEQSVLANYLLWRFVRHRVNNLDDRFQMAKQQFYYILFGREQAPPRWKNCVSQVNSNMGMALGSMFVRNYFDEMSKNDTLKMTREIQQSFRELLHMTDWIDANTKKLAGHKVSAMLLRIGYPDFILNKQELDERYKEVLIHPDRYFENILNILQHLTKMEQARIGQPVNKTLWNTAPAVVNAYYSRNKNQIMFPAGILQPPFYHRHFPRSLNYGGIGVVIGHEITHGFDDKGRLFDCDGNLHRWWSDTAIEAFHRRAQCLIDQYGRYVVPEVNMKLDGVNTQGENIADNGGVKQAFRAYLQWVKKHGAEHETLPGLNNTHTQLFFLNFAQVWCGAMRPEAIRNKLKTAVHSPGRFRVIGTLSNSHDFAREFHCRPGSPMNPRHKCSVW